MGAAGGSCRWLRASEGGATRAGPWRKKKNPAGGAEVRVRSEEQENVEELTGVGVRRKTFG